MNEIIIGFILTFAGGALVAWGLIELHNLYRPKK